MARRVKLILQAAAVLVVVLLVVLAAGYGAFRFGRAQESAASRQVREWESADRRYTDDATLKKAAAAAVAIMAPAADARGPVEYRKHVGGIMVTRALTRAAARAT